jgi:hypothetical protein
MRISIIIKAERNLNFRTNKKELKRDLQALRSIESVQDHNVISPTTLICTFVFDNYQ